MSRKTKAVQAPTVANRKVLEPEPPSDLWAQMDAIHARLEVGTIIDKPADAFSVTDYAQRYSIGATTARSRIKRYVDLGEVEYIGKGTGDVKLYRAKK